MLIIINQGAQPLRTYLICRSEGSVLYSALQIGFVLLAYGLRKPIGVSLTIQGVEFYRELFFFCLYCLWSTLLILFQINLFIIFFVLDVISVNTKR